MSIEERKFEAGLMTATPDAPEFISLPGECPVGAGKIHKVEIYLKDFLWTFSDEKRDLKDVQLEARASRILDQINGRLGLPRRYHYEVLFSDCHFEGAMGMVTLAGTYSNGVSDYYLAGTHISMARIGSYLRLYFPDGAPNNVHIQLKQLEEITEQSPGCSYGS